jgi:hypothetical protein
MIQSTRRKSKWQEVLITVLPLVLALLFAGVLILRSELLRPGGVWLEKPYRGSVLTKNQLTLKLSAYSYTLLPLDRVEVRYWYQGIDQHVWKMLCVFQPREDKIYTCDFNFMTVKAPVGKKILVTFAVYGILMREPAIGSRLTNYSEAPDGWVCIYWQQKDVVNPCEVG